ncbi:DUF397 domain-containing protein [Streptomyces kurssanovii]|uniref:DUF397 domain-containing protein n=1 Tax=Streptomyces kurssanovii TaxID=67312 RepID=A0ABV3HQ47_9ACTN
MTGSRADSQRDDCVEVADRPDAFHVRDSKDKDGPRSTVTTSAWAGFIGFATL